MKNLLAIILVIFMTQLNAQNDSLDINSFTNFNQITLGASYGNFIGNVSEFTKHGGSFDLYYMDGKGKHVYGFNMNILMSDKKKEFSIPPGFRHYDAPATVIFGLVYGQILGNQHKSHFQAVVGLNYAWLLHRKQDQDIGGYHGIVPQVEFSRSFQIKKAEYSDYQYTSQYTPMRYDPSVSNIFIDVFVGYKQLLLNSDEGKGGLITIGVRYKMNKYSISNNKFG